MKMKKRIAAIFLALCAACAFASCDKSGNENDVNNNSNDDVENVGTIEDISLSELGLKVVDETGFAGIGTDNISDFEMSEKMIGKVYGIDTSLLSEYYGLCSETYDLLILGKANSEEDARSVKAQMQDYLDMFKANVENYSPEVFAKAKDTEIFEKGEFVCIAIADNYSDVMKTVKNNI